MSINEFENKKKEKDKEVKKEVKNNIDKFIKLHKKYIKYLKYRKEIEKEFKIHICSVSDEHFILKIIDKTIKIYIQVSNKEEIQNLPKNFSKKGWIERCEEYDDYIYIIIDDIMFYYI